MLESLTNIPIFDTLPLEQLSQLEPLFEYYRCSPDTVIFEQGDPAIHLYLLVNGSVSIRYKPYDGSPITLTHLGPGDAFGWSAVVGSPQYTSSLVSDTEVEAIRIRGKELLDLCLKQPETGSIVLDGLARAVSSRWKNAHAQVQSMLDKAMAKANSRHKKKEVKKPMFTSQVYDQEAQLRSLLERLSAYVEQFHGGTVEYAGFDGKTLRVRLGGACLGCPLQPSTLHGWVAGTVHQFFPEIEVVEER
jgi:CRP-like cAMP-binding protein